MYIDQQTYGHTHGHTKTPSALRHTKINTDRDPNLNSRSTPRGTDINIDNKHAEYWTSHIQIQVGG